MWWQMGRGWGCPGWALGRGRVTTRPKHEVDAQDRPGTEQLRPHGGGGFAGPASSSPHQYPEFQI